jgi:rSAM/selenodomain-associated transferase 1
MNQPETNGRIVVFARAPRHGEVKTRLARTAGAAAALAHYRTMLRDTLGVVREAMLQLPGLDVELCVAGQDPDGECARLAALHGAALAAQVGDSFGERLGAALDRALLDGRMPVLVGSDAVSLTAGDLKDALAALRDHDATFAPTEDGGFALVGLRRPVEGLFDDLPWGTDTLMAVTRRRLDELGVDWVQLRTLWDVDDEPGLRRWLARTVPAHGAAAPAA